MLFFCKIVKTVRINGAADFTFFDEWATFMVC